MHPEATLRDYQEDMNRQVEFEEYKGIMKASFLAECKNPYFLWKNKMLPWELANANENLTPDTFVTSEYFELEMRKEYQRKVKEYLLDREWFKLVDCLEEATNFWSFGRDFATMPTYNTYMPTKTHLLSKPDMLDGDNDDLGYRFNVNRVSPSEYLNTLKGYKMLPKANLRMSADMHRPKFYKKYRRLSNSRMQGFSTLVERGELEERAPQTFLGSMLNGAFANNGWSFKK